LKSRFYEDDKERWKEIGNLRNRVAEHLRVTQGSRVLDVLVGEGDFARAVAKFQKESHVVAGEILESDLDEGKRRVERDGLKQRVELLRIDVTYMPFADESFTHVVNFSGWEDFTAISGEGLINRAFDEMVRVLKTDGTLAVTFIPALTPTDEVSRKDKELEDFMYKSEKKPKFFDEYYFLKEFEKHGIELIGKKVFERPKDRLRPRDARGFIEWHCENYKSFYRPEVEMRPNEEIIERFKGFIDEYGIRERRSKFVLLIGKRLVDSKKGKERVSSEQRAGGQTVDHNERTQIF